MKNRTVVACLAVLPALSMTALAASNPGTNTYHGQAQRTSGLPNYGIVEEAPAKTSEPAAAIVPPAPVVATTAPLKTDRCAPIALSTAAVGMPCQTTAEFIRTLGLSPKKEARALAMIATADKALAH